MILRELLKDIEIMEKNADLEIDVTGIGCESAAIRPGEIFVAITGFKTDGHRYIEDAVSKGASCIICQETPKFGVPYIKVGDSRKVFALMSAALFDFPAKKLKLIGVTGTNGKTTVTHLIKHIIENCSGSKVGLIGTIGNLIGDREIAATLTTPDAYRLQCMFDKMVFEGCKYVVMEVSSHALSLSRVHGISYDIGIFTNLTPEHLDFHETIDEYAGTKAMLFNNCRNSIINIDDEYAGLMIRNSRGRVMTYALSDISADITARDIQMYPNKTEFDAVLNEESCRVKINLPGRFSIYNSLAAIAAGKMLGYDIKDIKKALFSCPGIRGRAEVLPTSKEYTVLVDYAHTPDALENIIRTAREITDGRVVTLFGCGGDRDNSKRPVMGKIATELSDIVIVTSDNPRTENPAAIIDDILAGIPNKMDLYEKGRLIVTVNRREAICNALDLLLMSDILILAGKGHETYQIIGEEKIHFDDREIVSEHLRMIRENRRKTHVQMEGLD